MDLYPDEASSANLIAAGDDDDITMVSESTAATPSLPRTQEIRCGMLQHCDCGSLSCQGIELQLPATSKTIYESWTISYRRHITHIKKRTKILPCTWWLTMQTDPGYVMNIEPKIHFDQKELANVIDCTREQYNAQTRLRPRSYDDDVERRLRKLDRSVQHELYKLLQDRTETVSNPFRRREYKLAVLLEVPGGDMTDAGSRTCGKGNLFRRLRDRMKSAAPHVEYRLIIRGDEVNSNDDGWGFYDRYAQPWKLADEAELAYAREKIGYRELLD